MKKNILIFLLVLFIIVFLGAIVGGTYAYLRNSSVQSNQNVISTLSCLDVSLEDVSSAINLEKTIPISDSDGLKTPGYNFKIKNNCNRRVVTEINLENLKIEAPNLALGINYIRVSLNNSSPALISEKTTKTATIANATSRNLLTTVLNKDEEKTFNLKLWIYSTATTQQVLGRTYEGKIVIVAMPQSNCTPNKPDIIKNAPNGTILASLNDSNYCFASNTLTTPGKAISTEYESNLLSTDDDYGTSYYFRGNVDNNYVVFADMCWRIVRVTGNDGTMGDYNNATKLVLYSYNTDGSSNPCLQQGTNNAFARYSDSTFNTLYNTDGTSNTYVGFMYGTPNSSTFEAEHENTNDSEILSNLKKWYDEKLRDYSDDYLADTLWCGDKRVSTDSPGDGIATSNTYYAPRLRINNGTPSLKCGDNKNDNLVSKYTSSDTTYGNAKLRGINGTGNLEYKIGLLTIDEMMFAGAKLSTANNTYYLYNNSNGNVWYTMSPSSLSTTPIANVMRVNTNGGIDGYAVTNNFALRPSISLKSSIKVSGTGTKSDPYIVKNGNTFLPDEYQRVSYIESTGTQYIDTDILMSNINRINGKFQFSNISSVQGLFGRWSQSNTTIQLIVNPSSNQICEKWLESSSCIAADTNVHSFDLSNVKAKIDGNIIKNYEYGNATDASTLVLFARRQDNSGSNIANYASVKLFNLKITDNNGTIERDFVPCYRKSDSAAGLYDLVHNVFYPNNGTGSFTVGADVN